MTQCNHYDDPIRTWGHSSSIPCAKAKALEEWYVNTYAELRAGQGAISPMQPTSYDKAKDYLMGECRAVNPNEPSMICNYTIRHVGPHFNKRTSVGWWQSDINMKDYWNAFSSRRCEHDTPLDIACIPCGRGWPSGIQSPSASKELFQISHERKRRSLIRMGLREGTAAFKLALSDYEGVNWQNTDWD